MERNDLIYTHEKETYVTANKNFTKVFNTKTNKYLNIVENGRSWGVWCDRKFLTQGKFKIGVIEQRRNNKSKDLNNLLKQLKNVL